MNTENQLASSRKVCMRDINATSIKCHSKLDLESHPILLRNDEILNQVQDDKKWKRDDEGLRGLTQIHYQNNCHSRMSWSGISTAFNNAQGGDPRLQASGMTLHFNSAPSSVLTGHLPPHGEAANFNAPSTWRERVAGGRMRGMFKEEALNKNIFRAPLRSGFTLIELLVVVLIIGILAAVALPQYQKAVEKSKATQAIALLRTVAQAAQVYYLENGYYPESFSNLDIDIPWTGNTKWTTRSTTDTRSNGEWSLQISTVHDSVDDFYDLWIGRLSGPYAGTGFIITLYYNGVHNMSSLKCAERTSRGITFNGTAGSYCQKLFSGILKSTGTYRSYVVTI